MAVAGTLLVDTNGYTGGDGNRRFRIYCWTKPPLGGGSLLVTNDLERRRERVVGERDRPDECGTHQRFRGAGAGCFDHGSNQRNGDGGGEPE